MVFPDFVEEKVSSTLRGNVRSRGDEVDSFAEGVHYYHDRIVPVCFRKLDNEIYADRVPSCCRSCRQMEFSERFVASDLGPAAEIARLRVESNVPRHLGPPVAPGDEFEGLPPSGVTGNAGIVMLLDDPASEVTIIRYIDLTSEEQKSVGLYAFGTANQSAGFVLLQLLRSLSHRFVQFTIRERLANVTEDGAFFTGNSDTFEGPCLEKFRTKEGDVCVVCNAGSVVCAAGEGVRLAHAPSWLVVEGEVEVGQVERLSGLAAVEFLGGPEVLEVLMVRPDLKRLARAFQVVSPLFQRSDDRQHFHVMDLVVAFDRGQAFGLESNRMVLSVLGRQLFEHGSGWNSGAVGHDTEGLIIRGWANTAR